MEPLDWRRAYAAAYACGGGRLLSEKDKSQRLTDLVGCSEMKTRMNVALGRTVFALGLAECAVTQIWQVAESVLLA